MVSGMLALLTLTTGAVGPASTADTAAQRYRIDLTIKQDIDLTAAGQGPQTTDMTGTAFVTLTMSDTTGGKLAHLAIDSMTVVATGQLSNAFTQDLADSLKGQWLHAYVVDGKISGTPTPSVEGNPALAVATAAINALFPGIGSKAASGQGWADTTSNDVTNDQGMQNTQQIVTWTVGTRDGETLMLTGTGSGSVTAEMGGQQITGILSSSATITSVIGGPSSKATITSTQELSVLNPALPEPIPVKVSSTATLVELP
jgi:hypothetical protein